MGKNLIVISSQDIKWPISVQKNAQVTGHEGKGKSKPQW
jgi:hypothetical protein